MIINQVKIFFNLLSLTVQQSSNAGRSFFVSIVLTMLSSGLSISLPFLFSTIIERLATNAGGIALVLIFYGLLWTGTQIIMQARFLIMVSVLEDAIGNLSLRLFKHLHSLSLRFHLDRSSGAIIQAIERAQNGFEMVMWAGAIFLMPVLIEIAGLVVIVSYWYGIGYAVLFLGIVASFIAVNLCAMKNMNDAQKKYNDMRSAASAAFMDSLLNVETVKYFTNQQFDYELCNALIKDQRKAGITKRSTEIIINSIQIVAIGFVFTLVSYLTGMRVGNGSTIAEFVLINGYFLQFILPLQHIVFALQQMRKGLQDMAQVQELLTTEPEIKDHPQAINFTAPAVSVSFNNVSFWYNPQRPILKDVSFTIPVGKTVAIVGPSGGGKSTLVRLLFRFFDVSAGSITINGYDIRLLTQDSLHKALGIVPQDVVLFNNTLQFNIAYGNTGAGRLEIEQAAMQAQLDTLIGALPNGYDEVVGERGLKLSGGEKQRVAIARVLLKKPLLYIFDEATSALDTHTESEIQNTIRKISFGATTLIVAHRLSTVQHADEILVLDNGTIIERGTHKELYSYNGIYAQLWQKQVKSC